MRSTRPRRGAAAIEFIVTLPVVVAVTFGMVELANLSASATAVRAAAEAGALAGADVREAPPATGLTIEATAEAVATDFVTAQGIVCGGACVIDATWRTEGGVQVVEVVVTTPYDAILNLGWTPSTITRRFSAYTVTQS